MKLSKLAIPTLLIVVGSLGTLRAADKWFDVNGAAPGGGPDGFGYYDGTWDTTTSNWNTDPTGVVAPTTWTDGDIAHFYAGSDTAADGIVTIPSPQTVGGLEVEEGLVAITGGSGVINLGANPWKVDNGATLRLANLNQVAVAAGNVLTLDGGTISNSIVGVGSGIITGTNTQIQLTANGGTINTPNGGPNGTDSSSSSFSIMVYTNTIAMATGVTNATLHKTGHGEFRAFGGWNFTSLDVKEGLYRINGAAGGGETGFGDVNGTVTVAGGAAENTSQGAALGTSLGITSPATRSFVLSGVGATLDSAITLSASWVINGNISGPGGFILNGWERDDAGGIVGSQTQSLTLNGTNSYGGGTAIGFGTLIIGGGNAIPNTSRVSISTRSLWGNGTQSTFNTAALQVGTSTVAATETIGSLAGGNATRGTVSILNSGSALITGADGTSSTFSGTISGAGSLQKTGAGIFTMDGIKTYTGDTKVLGGTLSTNSASLADTADVYLASSSIFNLGFSGSDTIKSLFVNGVAQAIGTWGAAGSGAANISALLSGSGILNVTSAGAPPGVAGDYNGNGVVDMADYVLWRNGGPLQNDSTTGVDNSDYTVWRANFGNHSGSGSGLGSGSAVPEPTTVVLLMLSGLGVVVRRRGC